MRPAVFIDRDGTLNVSHLVKNVPHPPATLEEFELIPGVAAACAALKSAGFILVVVTNQPDVGRGTQTQEMVEAMNERLLEWVPSIDRLEVCYAPGRGQPHPDNHRRKPEPGMLLDAARNLKLDLAASWMVGDRAGDIDAGYAAGCRTILVDADDRGSTSEHPANHTVTSFPAAAGIILASLSLSQSTTSPQP